MCWFRCSVLLVLSLLSPLHAEPLQIVDTLGSLQPRAGQPPVETQILLQLLQRYPAPYSVIDINRNRAREWTKTAGNACIPWLRKTTEREQHYLFSLPYMLESGITLVSVPTSSWHLELKKLQNSAGRVSLQQLLQLARPPIVGVERNRSYGDNIDAILRQQPDNPAIYIRDSAGEFVGSMLPMLRKGFVDLILEYPKIATRSGNALHYWPLAEADPYNAVFFACSRSAEGEKIVGLLNHVIRQQAATSNYQQLVLQSFPAPAQAQVLHDWQLMLSPQ